MALLTLVVLGATWALALGRALRVVPVLGWILAGYPVVVGAAAWRLRRRRRGLAALGLGGSLGLVGAPALVRGAFGDLAPNLAPVAVEWGLDPRAVEAWVATVVVIPTALAIAALTVVPGRLAQPWQVPGRRPPWRLLAGASAGIVATWLARALVERWPGPAGSLVPTGATTTVLYHLQAGLGWLALTAGAAWGVWWGWPPRPDGAAARGGPGGPDRAASA